MTAQQSGLDRYGTLGLEIKIWEFVACQWNVPEWIHVKFPSRTHRLWCTPRLRPSILR